jgi:hypothetical protein
LVFQANSNFSQAKPSLVKQIQAEKLGLAWFYSSDSGLFNGLRAFQIKRWPFWHFSLLARSPAAFGASLHPDCRSQCHGKMHPSMNFDFPEAIVSEDLEIQAFTESPAARAKSADEGPIKPWA